MPGVRFTGGFLSDKGVEYDIEIYDALYSGSAVAFNVDARGFNLSYDAVNDRRVSPIISSRLAFGMQIYEQHEEFIEDILGASESRFTVRVLRNDVLYWCGYIMTDISKYEDVYWPYTFDVVATDGLGRLKKIDYKKDLGGGLYEPYGSLTFVEHVLNCLKTDTTLADRYFGSSDIYLSTAVNWWHEAHGSRTTAKDPYLLSRVNGEAFAEPRSSPGTWKYDSAWTVLEQLMSAWNCRVFMSAGRYHIEQPDYRLNNDFDQRRYSKTGTQLSTAVTNYDRSLPQNTTGAKLATPQYDWFPPLQFVEVEYDHNTRRNWLDKFTTYWGSGFSSPLTELKGVSADSDTYFIVQGRIKCKLVTVAATPDPWRFEFNVTLLLGETTPPFHAARRRATQPNIGTAIMQYENATWETDTLVNLIDVSTDFVWGNTYEGYIDFFVRTPVVPLGAEESVKIAISANTTATDVNDLPLALATKTWQVEDAVLLVQNNDDAANFEKERTHKIVNTSTGNSDVIELKTKIGSAIKPWTVGKIQAYNGTSWVDTDEGWYVGGQTGNFQFSELLARAIMAGQPVPVQRMHASIFGQNFYFHNLTSDLQSRKWLMLGGSFTANTDEWNGEWWGVVYSPTGDHTTYNVYDFPEAPDPDTPTSSGRMVDPVRTVLNSIAAVVTSAAMTGGSTTTATLTAALQSGAFVDGETVKIVNPFTGASETLEIAATNTESATALQFVTAPTQDFPPYSYIIKDPSYPLAQGNSNVATYTITTGDPAIQIGAKKLWEHTVIIGSGSGTVNIGSTAGGTEYWSAIDYDTSGSIVYSQPKYFHTAGTIFFSGFSGTLTIKLYFK
jgi:hypothetical protein